jgi:hypothetical protein
MYNFTYFPHLNYPKNLQHKIKFVFVGEQLNKTLKTNYPLLMSDIKPLHDRLLKTNLNFNKRNFCFVISKQTFRCKSYLEKENIESFFPKRKPNYKTKPCLEPKKYILILNCQLTSKIIF